MKIFPTGATISKRTALFDVVRTVTAERERGQRFCIDLLAEKERAKVFKKLHALAHWVQVLLANAFSHQRANTSTFLSLQNLPILITAPSHFSPLLALLPPLSRGARTAFYKQRK